MITGVTRVTSGYAGGKESDADYSKVSSGTTDHAEVVEVEFDPTVIALADILEIFFTIHNPTTLDAQGSDIGHQYRSVIFYTDDHQLQAAKDVIASITPLWQDSVVTELTRLEEFYPAEDYHQNYFYTNPEQGYCQLIINPKLQKLRQKFAARIKA